MEDTWTDRDLPVLSALVSRFDDPTVDVVRPAEMVAVSGLTEDAVMRALTALCEAEPQLLQCYHPEEQRVPAFINGVTAEARRRVGAWPTPEAMVDRLVAAFTQAAEHEHDAEKKSNLRKVADLLGGALREIAIGVTATVVAQHV